MTRTIILYKWVEWVRRESGEKMSLEDFHKGGSLGIYSTYYEKERRTPEGVSFFSGYGVDYDIDQKAFTAAIVEHADGTVELVPVDLIRFADGPPLIANQPRPVTR